MVWELMLYCHHGIRLVCLLAFAFLLAGPSSCSHGESRRAKAIARGRDLFALHCSGCHGRKRLDLGIVPPDLRGIFDRRFLPSGRSATEAVIRSTILTGRSGIMPSFEGTLSAADIQDIILYLHTLKAPAKTATPAIETPSALRGGGSFFFYPGSSEEPPRQSEHAGKLGHRGCKSLIRHLPHISIWKLFNGSRHR
jgi:mono/diheme cytochrome c family protein